MDLFAGLRLWNGGEAHIDVLMWQGFGLSDTRGAEAFPNGEAFKIGTDLPEFNVARLIIRQTIGLGGEEEAVGDDPLWLAGTREAARLTLTFGRMSAKDIFDNNSCANDPSAQFMNWALMANEAWDYPADILGYTTGLTAELDVPLWAIRYGAFQVPLVSNGRALDPHLLKAWGMVAELERRWSVGSYPGALRVLAYLNRAHMGSYEEAVANPARPADIEATRAYRYKYGIGLNLEQSVTRNLKLFSRLGWSDAQNEAWAFSDVGFTITAGATLNGESWSRPGDTFGLAGILDGIPRVQQDFYEAGGTGILAGDGRLNYGIEIALEASYDYSIWKHLQVGGDIQIIGTPAYNRDRGPVSLFGLRLHCEM